MVAYSTPETTTARSAAKARKPKAGAKASRKTTRAAAKPDDAIKLLKRDHEEIRGWFDEFERTDDDKKKMKLAQNICKALKVHAQIEEEIFYPAAREADVDDDLLDEADVEHQTAKSLVAEIEQLKPGDNLFDAKVTVLGEYVTHHVKEEETQLFPECRESDMDLKELGARLAARRSELLANA